MVVDVTHIIRHDFKDVKNHEAAKKYLLQTLELLKEKFCIHLDNDDWDMFELQLDDIDEMRFRLPTFDCTFFLRDGFWQIESYFHYCQLLWAIDNEYWLSKWIFDIARVLGQKEAWHAEEYYTWNGMEEHNLEEWLEFVKETYKKPILEFIPSELSADKYEPIYHDPFVGYDEQFDELQNKIKGYRLVGISRIYQEYVQCEKDGYIYLINPDTLEVYNKRTIKALDLRYNGTYIIYKDEE